MQQPLPELQKILIVSGPLRLDLDFTITNRSRRLARLLGVFPKNRGSRRSGARLALRRACSSFICGFFTCTHNKSRSFPVKKYSHCGYPTPGRPIESARMYQTTSNMLQDFLKMFNAQGPQPQDTPGRRDVVDRGCRTRRPGPDEFFELQDRCCSSPLPPALTSDPRPGIPLSVVNRNRNDRTAFFSDPLQGRSAC